PRNRPRSWPWAFRRARARRRLPRAPRTRDAGGWEARRRPRRPATFRAPARSPRRCPCARRRTVPRAGCAFPLPRRSATRASSSLRRSLRRGLPRRARCCRAPPPRSASFSSSPSKGPICKANLRESQTRHSFERALGVGEGERVAIDRGEGGWPILGTEGTRAKTQSANERSFRLALSVWTVFYSCVMGKPAVVFLDPLPEGVVHKWEEVLWHGSASWKL